MLRGLITDQVADHDDVLELWLRKSDREDKDLSVTVELVRYLHHRVKGEYEIPICLSHAGTFGHKEKYSGSGTRPVVTTLF